TMAMLTTGRRLGPPSPGRSWLSPRFMSALGFGGFVRHFRHARAGDGQQYRFHPAHFGILAGPHTDLAERGVVGDLLLQEPFQPHLPAGVGGGKLEASAVE